MRNSRLNIMTQSPNAIGAGSSTNFIEFMLSQIDKILDDIPAQINEENHLLSDYVQKLLSVMEYDIPYTSSALMEKLDLKSKETFRKNYLHPAIKLNLIRMTLPDKPRSSPISLIPVSMLFSSSSWKESPFPIHLA